MRFRKSNLASTEKFAAFLQKKFDITNLQPLNVVGSMRATSNRFYTAETKEGKKIFIKATVDSHLAKHEFWANQHLYALNQENFTEAIAYYPHRPYAFCAISYEQGTPLREYLDTHEVDDATRINILENVYRIFCTLREGDVLHRDLHLNQMLYHEGKLKLIDFQCAASKNHYKEVVYNKFYDLVNRNFKYKRYVWDDANDMLLLFREIGTPESYAARFREMEQDMESYVGKGSVHYKLPSVFTVQLMLRLLKLKLKLYKGSKRESYKKRVAKCEKFLQELKSMQ